MGEIKCPKGYEWCDIHDVEGANVGDHRKTIGYGIEFYRYEEENETYINWMPNFSEWIIQPGQVRPQIAELRGVLSNLHDDFERFVREVTGQAVRPEPVYEQRSCEDPACCDQTHEWVNGERTEACAVEPIEHPEGWFRVHAGKSPGDLFWEVWVDADRLPDGEMLSTAVDALSQSVDEMQIRVKTLNAAVQKSAS